MNVVMAGAGDVAMAGYLVHANRWALFAGKLDRCETQLRAIETASHRLQTELRVRRADGHL